MRGLSLLPTVYRLNASELAATKVDTAPEPETIVRTGLPGIRPALAVALNCGMGSSSSVCSSEVIKVAFKGGLLGSPTVAIARGHSRSRM